MIQFNKMQNLPSAAVASSAFFSSFLASAFFSSFFSSTFSSALSFFPRRPPKREVRLPRETERLLLLDFFFFLSSSEELLEADPARTGAAARSAGPGSVSAGLVAVAVVASTLFLGADSSLAAVAASGVGFPSVHVSAAAAGTSEMQPLIPMFGRKAVAYQTKISTYSTWRAPPCSPRWKRWTPWLPWPPRPPFRPRRTSHCAP
jgi:hypothetical protein